MQTKPIPGYEDRYTISENGDVFSLISNRYLSQCSDKDGYKFVKLNRAGEKRKSVKIHRLLAEVFIPNPNNYPVVNHKDENKTNNDLNNLEWCTIKYNCNYGTSVARTVETKRARHYFKKVVCINEKDCKITVFPSMTSTQYLGFNPNTVCQVCNHYIKTHKGCNFVFYKDWIRGDAQ